MSGRGRQRLLLIRKRHFNHQNTQVIHRIQCRPQCFIGFRITANRKNATRVLHGKSERRYAVANVDGIEVTVINRHRVAGIADDVLKNRPVRVRNFREIGPDDIIKQGAL